MHTPNPVLGNPLPGKELLLASRLFQCLHAGCLLEQRHLDVVLIARNLLLATLQFYVVVLLTTRLLLLPLMGDRHLNQAQWRLAEEFQASFSEDRKLVFSLLMTEAPRSGHALLTGSERQTSANSRKHGQRCRWFELTRITCSIVHSEGVFSTRFLPALSLAVFSGTSLKFVPFINQLFFIDSIVLYSLMEMMC